MIFLTVLPRIQSKHPFYTHSTIHDHKNKYKGLKCVVFFKLMSNHCLDAFLLESLIDQSQNRLEIDSENIFFKQNSSLGICFYRHEILSEYKMDVYFK